MQTPLRITCKGIPLNDSIRARIQERFGTLDRYFNRITGCSILIEVTNPRRHTGRVYSVRVDMAVPRGELAVTRQSGESLPVALREAFRAARRRLQDHARLLREPRGAQLPSRTRLQEEPAP